MSRGVGVVIAVLVVAVVGVGALAVSVNRSPSVRVSTTTVTDTSEIVSLQSQINSLNSELATDQTQISNLQSQVTNLMGLLGLSSSTIEANQLTVNQGAGATSVVTSFNAQYAGYIVVTGTSTTSNGYVMVTDSYCAGQSVSSTSIYSCYPYNNQHYSFGTGATLLVPVLPGPVSVIFGNTNLFSGVTATVTVTYFS